MTDQTVADLVNEFQQVSKRIQRFHDANAGMMDEKMVTEAAYYRNTRALFEIEQRLRNAKLDTLVNYLRVEHELTVARALARHSDTLRASNLNRMRRSLKFWLGGSIGQVVMPREDTAGHDDSSAG
jgi:hypothetical protein